MIRIHARSPSLTAHTPPSPSAPSCPSINVVFFFAFSFLFLISIAVDCCYSDALARSLFPISFSRPFHSPLSRRKEQYTPLPSHHPTTQPPSLLTYFFSLSTIISHVCPDISPLVTASVAPPSHSIEEGEIIPISQRQLIVS